MGGASLIVEIIVAKFPGNSLWAFETPLIYGGKGSLRQSLPFIVKRAIRGIKGLGELEFTREGLKGTWQIPFPNFIRGGRHSFPFGNTTQVSQTFSLTNLQPSNKFWVTKPGGFQGILSPSNWGHRGDQSTD